MYLPHYHAMPDVSAMLAHIEQHPLGAWVCSGEGGLIANHLPFTVDQQDPNAMKLHGHVARANPVWRALTQGQPSVVMFMGPQAYITPNWYPSKQAHGKVVPTWNYVSVHAHGCARAIDDPAWLLQMLSRLTDAQEASQLKPWQVMDAPADYLDDLLQAIVGIEISIERLEGRVKASQDEALDDRRGTVVGLRDRGVGMDREVAAWVEKALPPEPMV